MLDANERESRVQSFFEIERCILRFGRCDQFRFHVNQEVPKTI